jgi:hypothetical protein
MGAVGQERQDYPKMQGRHLQGVHSGTLLAKLLRGLARFVRRRLWSADFAQEAFHSSRKERLRKANTLAESHERKGRRFDASELEKRGGNNRLVDSKPNNKPKKEAACGGHHEAN